MDHMPILVLITFVLWQNIPAHVIVSLDTENHLTIDGTASSKTLRRFHKRQADPDVSSDPTPPNDLGSENLPGAGGGGNRTGDRPWRRGGGRGRHGPGGPGQQGCNFKGRGWGRGRGGGRGRGRGRGRGDKRPPPDGDEAVTEASLVKRGDGPGGVSSHRGNRGRSHRRVGEECNEEGGAGNTTTTTAAPAEDIR